MDGLYPASVPFDLGPSQVFPTCWSPRRTQVSGTRAARLRSQVRVLCPLQPGIYAMFDREGKLIYIGKAKSLRTRVLSYFRPGSRVPKAGKILAQTRSIVWEVLPSEFTALLRELELIRRWRPVCNVQGQPLRRRHTFLCLAGKPAPRFLLARRVPKDAVATYGPIPHSRRSQQAVRWLNDLFRLRDCPPGNVVFFPNRAELYPLETLTGCLRLELNTCTGPCRPDTSTNVYRLQIQAARHFLAGGDLSLLENLRTLMTEAAANQQFERAARFRDQHAHLTWLSDRLALMRQAQHKLSFVYSVLADDGKNWWYLIHGARVLGCVRAPDEAEEAQLALERLSQVYASPASAILLDAYEPVDGMMLVVSWFRKFARERKAALAPGDAEAAARRLLPP